MAVITLSALLLNNINVTVISVYFCPFLQTRAFHFKLVAVEEIENTSLQKLKEILKKGKRRGDGRQRGDLEISCF